MADDQDRLDRFRASAMAVLLEQEHKLLMHGILSNDWESKHLGAAVALLDRLAILAEAAAQAQVRSFQIPGDPT